MRHPTWDVFCRVVDNFGDIGVCWRLAADLAQRGVSVRLRVDDASALRWMAPEGARGVEILPWPADAMVIESGDVVVEAFGCGLPEGFERGMQAAARPPVWIDLAYLSAEDYVERSHGLWGAQPASRADEPAPVRKRFFFPGFTQRTGGLLREPDLERRRQPFDATGWLASRGIARQPGERIVGLFCYGQSPLPALLADLAERPTLLLATAGHATQQVDAAVHGAAGSCTPQALLRVARLPLLTQPEFDHLLWADDINFVRGEDSFVRAQWAGKPFVWQIYRQDDGAHLVKLEAFLDRFTADAEPVLARAIRELWRAWNTESSSLPAWPDQAAWTALCHRWRAGLVAQDDLVSQLLRFAAASR